MTDPGKIDCNVVFKYLDIFHDNKDEIDRLKMQYKKGGLGDTTIKNLLNDTLQAILKPMRERREAIKDEDIEKILFSGSSNAREVAQRTMKKVRSIMSLNYFDPDE